MSNLVQNEKTKLLAAALNSAAGSSFTIGVLGPLAAAFYKLSGASEIALWTIIIGIVIWILIAVANI